MQSFDTRFGRLRIWRDEKSPVPALEGDSTTLAQIEAESHALPAHRSVVVEVRRRSDNPYLITLGAVITAKKDGLTLIKMPRLDEGTIAYEGWSGVGNLGVGEDLSLECLLRGTFTELLGAPELRFSGEIDFRYSVYDPSAYAPIPFAWAARAITRLAGGGDVSQEFVESMFRGPSNMRSAAEIERFLVR